MIPTLRYVFLGVDDGLFHSKYVKKGYVELSKLNSTHA